MRYMIDLFAQLLTMISVNKNTACFHFNIFSFSQGFSRWYCATVSAKLYVWPKGSVLQSRLRNHRWSLQISKVALLSVSMFCNEGGVRGEGNSRVKCTLNSISPVTNLKGITLNLTLTCPALKICTSRIYYGLFYASRIDPLPPSCFTMLIFSRIELRLAHK